MTGLDEARKRLKNDCASVESRVPPGEHWRDIRTVLDALDAAERERDEALAVIEALVENSQRVAGGPVPWVEIEAEVWDRYLTGVPADVLRERDAEKWDEGYRSGHSRAMRSMSDEPGVEPALNPYRETKEQG